MKNNKKTYKFRGSDLHKGQLRIVKSILNSPTKYTTINASRQSGKSFLMQQLILFFGINKTNSEILIVSPYNSQNLKIYNEITNAIINSGIIKSERKSEKIIELINGSKLVFKSAENYEAIRSGSYDYIFGDEFAYWKEDAWNMAVRPTMAAKKNSRAFLFSTPRGKNNFYDMAMRGMDKSEDNKNYSYYFMIYSDNPLYDISLVEDCKRQYPSAKFKQEFLGEFIDGGSVFEDYIKCATIHKYEEPKKELKYYGGLDLANKVDKTVLTIIDSNSNVVYKYSNNKTNWKNIVDDVVRILRKYNAHCLIEVNSIGDVIYEMVYEQYREISPIFTSNGNKQEYIEDLIYAFSTEEIQIQTKELDEDLHLELDVFEMSYSPKTRKVKYAARDGFHDDHIISLSLSLKCKKDNNKFGEMSCVLI